MIRNLAVLLALFMSCAGCGRIDQLSVGGIEKKGCTIIWREVDRTKRIHFMLLVEPNGPIRMSCLSNRIPDSGSGVVVNQLGLFIDGKSVIELPKDRAGQKVAYLRKDGRVQTVELDVARVEEIARRGVQFVFDDAEVSDLVKKACEQSE